MRKTYLAAWLILAAAACGAAAPNKAATKPSAAAEMTKDVKLGMTEQEATDALKKSGVEVKERIERDTPKGPMVVLRLADRRSVSILGGKVSGFTRDTMPDTPAELQKDAKVGMTEAEAQAALDAASVKVGDRKRINDALSLWKLEDGRAIVFQDGKVKSIQRPATQPAK